MRLPSMRGMRGTTAFVVSTLTTTLLIGVSSVHCSSSDAAGETPTTFPTGGSVPSNGTSGTRLRARVIAGGGARDVVGYHDLERNEDCTFSKAEDGRVRCLPETVTTTFSNIFSDAKCTTPILSQTTGAPPTCSEAQYAIVVKYDSTCGTASQTEIRKLVLGTGARYVSGGPGGGCTLQPGTQPAPSSTIKELGEVVPWTAFVEATETIVPGTEIAEKAFVTSDGARLASHFYNEKLGSICSYEVMVDGTMRCIPGDASMGQINYSDSECVKAASVTDNTYRGGGSCNVSSSRDGVALNEKLWIEPNVDRGSCGGIRAVYSLGESESTSASDLFTWRNTYSGSSSTTPSNQCTRAFGLGASGSIQQRPIAADLTASLPRTTTRFGTGSGRLVPALVAMPSSMSTRLEKGWHDNERNVDCTFALATDGKMRCLPVAAQATLFFTDKECRGPSVVAVPNAPLCVAIPGTRFARVPVASSCPPRERVFSLGVAQHDLNDGASSRTSETSCPLFPAVKGGFDATEVDPSQFVEGSLVTE